MNKKLWNIFTKWGSGFKLEAERDYKDPKESLIYHLFIYGICYPSKYELVGDDIGAMLKQAILDGKSNYLDLYR